MSIPLYNPADGFSQPCRRLVDPKYTFALFNRSPAYLFTESLVRDISRAVCGFTYSSAPKPSPAVSAVVEVIDKVHAIIETWPLAPRGHKIGNPAFTQLIDHLYDNIQSLHEPIVQILTANGLPADTAASAVLELAPYLLCGWGHARRLDYGTGHELSFMQWLVGLVRLGVLGRRDLAGVGLQVMPRYWKASRLVQTRFTLEPAGSRGMWGLDDFNYLPFVIGSAQLTGLEDMVAPASLLRRETARAEARDSGVAWGVYEIIAEKMAPMAESSPVLHGLLTSSRTWRQFHAETMQMWLDEVLNRFTAAQHFLFGGLLPFVPDSGLSSKARAALAEAAARGLTAPGALSGVGIGEPDGADFVHV